ncbi:heavy-metal-associated domain-containing protein [Flavobacterium caeni]|uniref:Heavy-metal-associated domain-containing protein n=1 Tax=Flavobacterium caeni TaxID=490189 RepID=A0A1G5I3Y5_9FLAO|nr:heavy metal-associated domain-containing protein [Flavobacterium caeni]SCY70379.1 Heavy-metal-associated domain-containing protein [Flavobacterium caeni]
MTHTYTVTGMTCNGCRVGIEDKLGRIPGVVRATVSLEQSEAVIEMKTHISTGALQNAIGDKYKIYEKNDMLMMTSEEEVSDWKKLTPLFLIFGYITVAAVLINRSPWDGEGFMLDFMGLFYIVFSFFKMLDLKGFPDSFRMYDPLAKKVPFYATIYPFLETALGLMFLLRFQTDVALYATLVILGITTYGVTRVLLDKKAIQCACLGTALKLPMTKATFIENSIMIVMALLMIWNHM